EDMISLSAVHWLMQEDGWTFKEAPGVIPDTLHGAALLHQVYTAADPLYSGRVTVPILWDKQRGTIVNNESSAIIRRLRSAGDGGGAKPGGYSPQALRAEIDAVNEPVYGNINNGAYTAGLAPRQPAYDKAVGALFSTLEWGGELLGCQRYLVGDQLTE